MTDMKLDDELKLRVATRLMDKSVAIWWDNLKLRSTVPVTWSYFVHEFNENVTMIKKNKNFSDISSLAKQ